MLVRWFGGGFALFVMAAQLAAAPAADRSARLDGLFSPLVPERSPGMAVLVIAGRTVLFKKGYGLRDVNKHEPITATTNFRLASFTKQFTAAATLLLVQDGKLKLDQSLHSVFSDLPAYTERVTIRQLLNHTAGLPDYEDLMEAAEKNGHSSWTKERQIQDEEVLQLLRGQTKPAFEAGTRWSYSNSAYVVLGLIVAKVSGMPFGDFLEQRLFEPLGMKQTLVYQTGKNQVRERAFGYKLLAGEFVDSDQSSTSATLGDGGIYSNLEDLSRWAHALSEGKVLKSEWQREAWTACRLADGAEPHWPAKAGEDNLHPGKPVAYGYGWFLDPYKSNRRMWHSGTTSGFRTVIQRYPDKGITIVILCNRTDLDPVALAEKAFDAIER